MVFPWLQCFVGKDHYRGLVFKFTKMNVYKMIATSMAYFLVSSSSVSTGQSNNVRSSFDKAVIKNNDFDGSVSVRNGRVFVNWSTIGPWNLSKPVNMSVYFLSNYTDHYGNISYGVNITTCVAKKNNDSSWKINSMKGNLLEFCNKSGLCGPFDDDVVVLIDSDWMPKYKNLSCQLFTTCSNFISTFGIQIIVDANNRQYSYHSGDLSIPSQNIPPSPTNIDVLQLSAIGISWNYPNLSQLCGFGSKGSTNIKFLIRQYKSNRCIFIEEKTLDFDDDAHFAIFTNMWTSSNYKYIFYLSAMSLTSNQTSRPWLKQIRNGLSQDPNYAYKVDGGILSFSWQPEWNCLEKDVVEQILLCIIPSLCVPVCQVTLFSNGSISPVASFSRNFINFCNYHSRYCRLDSNNTDIVDGQWNSSSRTISCNILKQCFEIPNAVSIKKNRIDAGTNTTDEYRSILLWRIYQPSAPTNLRIVSVHQTNATVAWDFQQCKTFVVITEFFICVLSSVEHHDCEKMENPSRKRYTGTVKGLSYFTNYSIQVYAENKYEKKYKSPRTSPLKIQTKEGAPLKGPTITRINTEKDGIKLSWELPSKNDLRGIPKIFIIEVLDDKNQTVLNETLNGTNITSAVIKDLEKCDSFRIKICNSPTLCSQFSNLMQYEHPCGLKDPEKPKGLAQSPLFLVILLLSFLLVAAIPITCWAKRRLRRPRLQLPIPVPPDNCDTDYMQTSQVNEYNTLDQECLLLN